MLLQPDYQAAKVSGNRIRAWYEYPDPVFGKKNIEFHWKLNLIGLSSLQNLFLG